MIKVNLLPAAYVAERKRKAVQVHLLKIATLIALIWAVGFAGLFVLTLQVRNQIASVKEQRVALEGEIAAYAPLIQMQSNIEKRCTLLQLAMGNEFGWRDTISSLGVNIPTNVWLTNVGITREAEAASLTLRGLTYNHPSTAKWVDSLQSIEGISDVRVSYSSAEEVDNKALVRFEIGAVVGVGELYEPLKRGE